jgi:hypothetical protein
LARPTPHPNICVIKSGLSRAFPQTRPVITRKTKTSVAGGPAHGKLRFVFKKNQKRRPHAMIPPEIDLSTPRALMRSAKLLHAFVQMLMFITNIGTRLPFSLQAVINTLDTSLCRMEDLVFASLAPSEALENLRALRAARDLAFVEGAAEAAPSTEANAEVFPLPTQSVTLETREHSEGPSPNDAARADHKGTRQTRRPHSNHPHSNHPHPHANHPPTDQFRARPIPQARPPPAHGAHRLKQTHRTSPRLPGRPCWRRSPSALAACARNATQIHHPAA